MMHNLDWKWQQKENRIQNWEHLGTATIAEETGVALEEGERHVREGVLMDCVVD